MKFIILLIILFTTYSVLSQTGRVIKVKDGDTVVILDDNKVQYTIRVADIDCPEKNQPFGKKAKWFVSDEIFGKIVTVKQKNKDRYGRIVGYVLYENKNLSYELLKAGLAWHYSYYSDNTEMKKLEKSARKNKLGLWNHPNPINPYKWRKGKRN